MASVNVPQPVSINHEGSNKKPRIDAQVYTMVEAEETISALPTTSVTWIPIMEQVLEFEVVESPGNKAGKMKARARARAKEKPSTRAGLESATPTPPPARKSQRARQPPAKFRYLVPRPLGQQGLPPIAPSFVRPPSSNGIPPLPLPSNLMMPFPPIPVSTPPGSSTLSAPGAAGGALHLSTFPSINDQALQPTSTSALTPTLLIPRAQPAFVQRRRLPVASKRSAVRKKLPPSPSQEHAGLSQSSLSHSQSATSAGTAPSPAEAIVSETALRGGGTPTCTRASSMCATQVASGSSWPNAIQDPRSSLRPYVGSDIGRTLSSPVQNGAVTSVHCRRSVGKPPLPPHSWFLTYLRRNPPHPPPSILKRSFAHVPPPPTHESHPMVPPRASLNNRDLRFPKPTFDPHYPHFASSQVPQASSTSQSVPWLVPPQGHGNQRRIPGSDFSGHSNGINIPGQTRSQQKRRMRQLKNGITKKFQDLMQGATLIQEPDSQHKGVTTVKKIVLTDEQRTKLVNEMIEACRSDPKFRAKYLDAVKHLSYYGVLQTASYHLVAQAPSKSAQEVVEAWKNQLPPTQEGSTSASIKFYTAVSKVHEEETMQKLPNLREAGSCSVTKRNDGAWVVTLPDEKKRKFNGEPRPTNGS